MNIREQVADLLGVEDRLPSGGDMVLALNVTRKHVYAGTVPHAEVLRRRKANKVARASRRRNRGRR